MVNRLLEYFGKKFPSIQSETCLTKLYPFSDKIFDSKLDDWIYIIKLFPNISVGSMGEN